MYTKMKMWGYTIVKNREYKTIDDKQMKDNYEDFTLMKKKVRPELTALKILGIYVMIGSLWILLSDKVLVMFHVSDSAFKEISIYKGWFYVIITGLIFFLIIYRSLRLYKESIDYVLMSYEELNSTYEEIMAMNEELDQQNSELQRQTNALMISEQRNQVIVDGSYDGIWDWDILNDIYFIPDKWKKEFGYEPDEIGKKISQIKELFYPGDWEKVKESMDKYLIEENGIFESICRIRKKSGEYRWILTRGKGVLDENGKLQRIAGSHTDITERKKMEEKLESLAYYDTLTGLPNRILFERKVTEFIEQNQRLAIINLDIDDLKRINDLFGQEAGDKYLNYIANSLTAVMSDTDIIAHLSGNQFAIAHVINEKYDDTKDTLELLFRQIRIPWEINEDILFVTSSAGLAMFPEHGTTFATLMQNAEIAMFNQKDKGKDGYTFFQPIMYEETLMIGQINTQLRKAIENEEFVLYYQPQYDLKTGKMIAMEALIRWNHPEKGIIPPMEFIPFSEKTGQIIPISIWVLKTAIMQKREWEKKGYESLKIAVNMSGHVIADESIVDTLCEMLQNYEIKPGEIEIEVTETAVMLDLEKAKDSLKRLRSYGISIAMDDFGTGYSSLTYLHSLPFDILKMDREFIKNIKTEDEDSFIYKTVIDLAHNMDLIIVAEGIETREQRDFLLKYNCDLGQGYYFSKPIPASEIEKMLI